MMLTLIVALAVCALIAHEARRKVREARDMAAATEARVRGEYAARGAVAWASHELQPAIDMLRATDHIAIAWTPDGSEAEPWTCKLEHRSGDVETRGATPRLAVDRAMAWMRDRERNGVPRGGTYKLLQATRDGLEAERLQVVTVHDDDEED